MILELRLRNKTKTGFVVREKTAVPAGLTHHTSFPEGAVRTSCSRSCHMMQVEHLALTPDVGRRVRALAAALEEAEGHHAVEASAQAGRLRCASSARCPCCSTA
jgi:hypothetical protein